jgi:capsular exopolysaccharide synthesis family protein
MTNMLEAMRQSERDGAGSFLLNQTATVSQTASAPRGSSFDLSGVEKLNVHCGDGNNLVAFRTNDGMAEEKFGLLAAKLSNIRAERGLKSVLVTSSAQNEGKSLVAANIAVTLAMQARKRVLLLEGDLRRPGLGGILGVGPLAGLGDWATTQRATTQQPINRFIYQLGKLSLWLLPAGKIESPTRLLQSQKLVDLFPRLRDGFDWVIIDSPPVLPLADTNLWARMADAILLVAREDITPRKALRKALDALDNSRLLGIVLNEASERDLESSYDPSRNQKIGTATAQSQFVGLDAVEKERAANA